jgi:hypothetical protein
MIYGNQSASGSGTQCCTSIQPTIPPFVLLQQLVQTLEKMKTAIEKFYPPAQAVSIYIGTIPARAFVPPAIGFRLAWIQTYGKETIIDIDGNIAEVTRKFNANSEIDRLQLMDLYLAAKFDWRTDPMFIKMGLV